MGSPWALRDYALVADGERGAVIDPSGDIAWMCFPGWDDEPLFAALLGGAGRYLVRPKGRFVWGGQYEPGTLVWRNRWLIGSDIVECLDLLAFPGRPDRAVVVRRVLAVRGPAHVDVALAVAQDFGRPGRLHLRRGGPRHWEGRRGDLHIRWHVPVEPSWHRGTGAATLRVDAGDHADLVLELGVGGLDDDPLDAAGVLDATLAAWRQAVPEVARCAAPRDARHAIAVLTGMTTSTGAMVAAATTSLPERADEGHDYDYRYAWIRDQCYAGRAAATTPAGERILDAAVGFVAQRLVSDGSDLRPAYRASGQPLPSQHSVDLPGYPGGPSVVIGNLAADQFQLDVFGEALLLFAAAARIDRLPLEAWTAVEIAARTIEARWSEPDSGVWEINPASYTHSRLICAAGLRQTAAAGPSGATANRWLALADAIVSRLSATAVHPSGRWQRTPDDPMVDAALLLGGLRGAVAADDPRTRATLAAVRDELVVDGYVFRYHSGGRPLGKDEGAFLLCGFWLALASAQAGQQREAVRLFERNRAACGPAGLFAEEYDVHQRQLRGNFPQAFVHALLLETAVTLGPDLTTAKVAAGTSEALDGRGGQAAGVAR